MKPKILLYDIETSPNLGYVWGMWQQNVIEFNEEWNILCVAYKWLGEREVHYFGQDTTGKFGCDKQVTKQLHALFDEADVTIAHNGDSFDKKKANSRFLLHGLTPPSPYKTVDTLKIARKQFKFNSNRLNDLGNLLGCGSKVAHGGFSLWRKCMNNDESAWKRMAKYAKKDVRLLECVYLNLLPWIESHPNYGLFTEDRVCPNCGSTKLVGRGKAYKDTKVYQRFQCKKCGKYSQSIKCEPGGAKTK